LFWQGEICEIGGIFVMFLAYFYLPCRLVSSMIQQQKDDDEDPAGIFPTRMGLLGSRMGASLVF